MNEYSIKIFPQSIKIIARKGELLFDVLQRSGIPLEAICGGQGTCGRCGVRLVEGTCEWSGSDLLSRELIQKHFVLACQAKIIQDVTIEIPKIEGKGRGIDYSTTVFSEPEVVPPGERSPLSKLKHIDVPEPSLEMGMSDYDRLISQLPQEKIHCSLPVLRSLPETLRQKGGSVTATIIEQDEGSRIIRLEAGKKTTRNFGLACDVGTTTVAVQIVDLNTGDILDTSSSYNEQIDCGSDIISRIIYAQKKGHLHELHRRIVKTINHMIHELTSTHGIDCTDINSAVFSGNTSMTHLLLEIDPKFIREEPYVPAIKQVKYLYAEDLGIAINPNAVLYFTPCVGSYLGGDITSGLLYIRTMRKRKGVELFLDIGTNGELIISGDDWMIGCACSAGPAFEGVGIRCGMRAASGAIDSVGIRGGGREVTYRVEGKDKPRGICGSGLIETVADLFSNHVIGRDGKFNEEISIPPLRSKGRNKIFVLCEADQSFEGQAIYICEQDIMNIMRAKAAIYSGCALLLKNIGLHYSDIENIYIGGGFGYTLNIEKAITIGLFPDIAPERFRYLGNTSLMGAYLTLLYSDHRQILQKMARDITYIDLSSEPNYMDEYSAALFLPHTDASLFPTIESNY